jgi:hypothetical protein
MTNVLFIMLIWIPLDGAVEGSVQAEYIERTFATAALCEAAREGETQIFWNSKPGHRMLGIKECTDGALPVGVKIGEFTVTVAGADG